VEGLLAVVGLGVMTKGIRTDTERWRERVPDFRGCDAEAASAKRCADKRSREEIGVGDGRTCTPVDRLCRPTSKLEPGRTSERKKRLSPGWQLTAPTGRF